MSRACGEGLTTTMNKLDMGDLTFLVPATTTTATPEAAAAAEPAEPAAGPAAPRCRRVHFRDLSAATLWFPPSPPDDDAMAKGEPPPGLEEETGAAAAAAEEDTMDQLWEDFNEELLAIRRAGGPSYCSRELSSDGEYEPAAAAGRVPAGCFPVLRPSARVGGAGHCRRRAGSWVLLMRIFRRLFVVDKTITAAASGGGSSRHHATTAR